jgi:opacity protein-like surface antigen
MKKFLLLAALAVILTATQTFAQSYKNSLGLGIDFGDGSTLVGPSYKHFFTGKDAVQAELLFSDNTVWAGGYYQYHQPFSGTPALKWYLGLGPQFAFVDGAFENYTVVLLRPMAGLDYKIANTPIALNFDWRPMAQLNHGSGFEAARFGVGFRFTFK